MSVKLIYAEEITGHTVKTVNIARKGSARIQAALPWREALFLRGPFLRRTAGGFSSTGGTADASGLRAGERAVMA
jgi:hypothetical protein